MRALFLFLSLVAIQLPFSLFSQTAQFTPWETIMERDIVSKTRIWREIDVEANPALFKDDRGQLLSLLKDGINSGKIKAYDPVNDRFTKEISVNDIAPNVLSRPVVKWLIKEDELLVQGKAETVVRILGIAPVYVIADKNGDPKEFAMFWIYYPDCRTFLSAFPATAQYSWDEVFNGRHFKAKITRFTPAK
jgi:hypothetical protein